MKYNQEDVKGAQEYEQDKKKMSFEPQVHEEQYFKKSYNAKNRWISYWYQINQVLECDSDSVCEIGIGNGIVCDSLKKFGLNVTTVDIDPELNPDYVCSVTDLRKVFNKNSFDVVLCAEVLEHIPFNYFEKALDELDFISKNWAIISLPIVGLNFSFRLPLIGAKVFHLKHLFPKNHKFDGEHYWEIGKREYPLNAIIKSLEKKFTIIKNFIPPENTYHIFFVLKKN